MKKRLKGIVVKDGMEKTIVVKIDRTIAHPIYLKRYKISKKYKVHDEKNEHKIGDLVQIEETRPISKDKRWKVVQKAKSKESKESKKESKKKGKK